VLPQTGWQFEEDSDDDALKELNVLNRSKGDPKSDRSVSQPASGRNATVRLPVTAAPSSTEADESWIPGSSGRLPAPSVSGVQLSSVDISACLMVLPGYTSLDGQAVSTGAATPSGNAVSGRRSAAPQSSSPLDAGDGVPFALSAEPAIEEVLRHAIARQMYLRYCDYDTSCTGRYQPAELDHTVS